MANLSALEKRQLEDLFGMASGYVMDFSNNSFDELFRTAANINIYDQKYNLNSGSKANRMRAFWEKEPDAIVGQVLNEMLAVWAYENDNQENKAFQACRATVERLLGKVQQKADLTESEFLEQDFGEISVRNLKINESSLIPILESRLKEAGQCLKSGSPLAVIFLCGSVLEGILLGVAQNNPQKFNQSRCAPRDKEGQVRRFHEWSLADLINTAHDAGFLKLDVKKFSEHLRDFRNYIHPYAQMSSGFSPDQHTARICLQVLKAAIAELSGER